MGTSEGGDVDRSDAAAVDVPCPICGKRPIQEVAIAPRVTGLVGRTGFSTPRHTGCHRCVRRKNLKSVLLNLLLGWWTVPWLLLNPFAIVWNVLRAAVDRSPSAALDGALRDVGVHPGYLRDTDEFDPDQVDPDEVLVPGLVKLGDAVMLRDGDATLQEGAAIRDFVADLSETYDAEDLEPMIEETGVTHPDLDETLAALAAVFTTSDKRRAVALARRVADASGESPAERAAVVDPDDEAEPAADDVVQHVADALGVDPEA